MHLAVYKVSKLISDLYSSVKNVTEIDCVKSKNVIQCGSSGQFEMFKCVKDPYVS